MSPQRSAGMGTVAPLAYLSEVPVGVITFPCAPGTRWQ